MAETSPKKAIAVILLLVAALAAGLFLMRGTTPPGQVTNARLAALQAAVSAYAAEHGAPPATLAELPAETPFVDSWNHPLTYRVLDDGRVEIGSLGGDGKPGGHMFKADRILTFEP